MKEIKNVLSQALFKLYEYELNNGITAYQEFSESEFRDYTEQSSSYILSKLSLFFSDSSAFEKNNKYNNEFFKNKKYDTLIEKLERFISFSTWLGEINNKELSRHTDTDCESDFMFEVLIRLHGRASLVSNEILCLIKSGYPDAAISRWRTLYEILVIFISIFQFGPDCAERFYYHHITDKFKALIKTVETKERFPSLFTDLIIDNDDTENLEKLYKSLINKYGNKYRFDYGWLEGFILPSQKNSRLTFTDIEKHFALDHYAPYSKIASQNIHATSQSIHFSTSLNRSSTKALGVGKNSLGMIIPIQGVTLSLFQITSNFLDYCSSKDNKIFKAVLYYKYLEIMNLPPYKDK